MNIKYMLIKYL